MENDKWFVRKEYKGITPCDKFISRVIQKSSNFIESGYDFKENVKITAVTYKEFGDSKTYWVEYVFTNTNKKVNPSYLLIHYYKSSSDEYVKENVEIIDELNDTILREEIEYISVNYDTDYIFPRWW